jgi:vacuolar-type H+-ATPase subunit E/Vma4
MYFKYIFIAILVIVIFFLIQHLETQKVKIREHFRWRRFVRRVSSGASDAARRAREAADRARREAENRARQAAEAARRAAEEAARQARILAERRNALNRLIDNVRNAGNDIRRIPGHITHHANKASDEIKKIDKTIDKLDPTAFVNELKHGMHHYLTNFDLTD